MNGSTLTSSLLRGKYFAFFAQRNCALISSAPLVPENDPTALFTVAGMQPLVPYLLGEPHPAGKRLVDVQRCFRTEDIDLVGDATHLTFFEMLGSWSMGDYFKEEMIPWTWEFLTGEEWLGIDPQHLHVTVFAGDEQAPKDEESIELWQKQFATVGIDARMGERIFPLDREENWWGPVGQSGPCGPDTEIFFNTGRPPCGRDCRPGCGCGKYVELCNDVFMEYNMLADGSCEPLEQKNVDMGMGMERTVAALNRMDSVFETDVFASLIDRIGELSGRECENHPVSFRVVADHVRAAAHLLAEGLLPANVEQGYVLRRLIRRAVRHGRLLGLAGDYWKPLVEEVVAAHPLLRESAETIVARLGEEQVRFERTLEKGLKQFEQLVSRRISRCDGIGRLGGEEAFDLFATYGFPLEMTCELARERGLEVDEIGFRRAFDEHQERSRQGAERRFAGGLTDHSETATRYHTATHLLHAALRRVLGEHVEQRGSHINAERLRFDFSHPARVTPEELSRVEELVNGAIGRDFPIDWTEMSPEEARRNGAIGLFTDRYGERVKVYAIGNMEGTPEGDPNAETFSKEVCGGPHVERTGLLGRFRVVKEHSASSGVRRIRGVLK